MIYLVLATVCSSLIPVVMRFGNNKIKSEYGMYMVNYLLCIVLSLFFMQDICIFPNVEGIRNTFIIGALTGVLYLASLYYYDLSVNKAGVVLTTIFKKVCVVLPVLIAIVFFGEKINIKQSIGILLSICAIIIINYEKNSFKKIEHIEILLLSMLTGGLAESSNNIFNNLGNPELKDQFFFYIFLFAALTTLAMMIITKKGIGKNEIILGLLLGVPNYFSTRFLTMSLFSVPAVVAYPFFFMVSMILITLSGVFLFKEKIDNKKIIAIAIVIVAMILLNI